jgi:hypothetical protein
MMTAQVARKLTLMVPMLGSDHPHEQLATLDAIKRVLAAAGKGFNDLVPLIGGGTCCCSLMEPRVIFSAPDEPSAYPAPARAPQGGWTEHEYNPWADERMRAQ